jgi:Acetyltransferase (GNAT) domain
MVGRTSAAIRSIVKGDPALVSAEVSRGEDQKEARQEATCFDPLTPTIFHEPWWLDAATGGNFEVVEASAGGHAVGRLPFSVTKRCGLKTIRMPHLTYFLGPAIDEGKGSPNARFLRRLSITRELLAKLPHASWQYMKCYGGTTDAIAFQELGFRTYVQFTYEIAPVSADVLLRQMRRQTRQNVRKAQEQLEVTEWNDPVAFVRMFERNLELKGLRNGLDGAICQKIVSACLGRRRGRILAARDKENRIVAANFCAWDAISTYYTLTTRCGDSGYTAVTLLLWEAIKESARRGLVFDFGGIGNRGSVMLYSGFGGSLSVRYVAVRASGLARALNDLRCLLAPENCFY